MTRPSFGRLPLIAQCLILLGWSSGPAAEKAADANRFLRLQRSAEGTVVALQTAVIRYRRGTGEDAPSVDLVGVIHVADRPYYERLNELFTSYDAVLYEMVAPPDAQIKRGPRQVGNPVSALQVGMTRLLGLSFQLDCIDYNRPNLVHADLTPEEFSRSMAERGESFTQMFLRMLGQAMAMQAQDSENGHDFQLLAALFSPDRPRQLKRLMAEQFEASLGRPVLAGPEGSTIITVRNTRALDVLAEQLEIGHRRLAIFYGAAHLPDLDAQLRRRFQLRPVDQRWYTAWQIEPRGNGTTQ